MDKFATYNRVQQLESYRLRSLLAALCILCSGLILTGLVTLPNIDKPLSQTLYALSSLCIVISLLGMLSSRNKHFCKHCHRELGYMVRPFYLQPEHLAQQGKVIDNHLYTIKQGKPISGKNSWVKLHNRSRVCHHCRIFEETSQQVSETVSAHELEKIESLSAST